MACRSNLLSDKMINAFLSVGPYPMGIRDQSAGTENELKKLIIKLYVPGSSNAIANAWITGGSGM